MQDYGIALVNMTDGSVQGHKAGCADLKRGARKFADAPWTFEVPHKEAAREAYNADFDEEIDGWYDIEWLPCANHVPAYNTEPEPTVTYADPANARRNFEHMAKIATSDQARKFWQDKAEGV